MAEPYLAKEWTAEEARAEATDSDESLPLAPTTNARRLVTGAAVGGTSQRAGQQEDPEESEAELSAQARPMPADPPRVPSNGGA